MRPYLVYTTHPSEGLQLAGSFKTLAGANKMRAFICKHSNRRALISVAI